MDALSVSISGKFTVRGLVTKHFNALREFLRRTSCSGVSLSKAKSILLSVA